MRRRKFKDDEKSCHGRLACLIASVAFFASLLASCDNSSKLDIREDLVLVSTVASSPSVSVTSFSNASTTLATAEISFAFPGDAVDLVAYVYAADTTAPANSGSIEFSASIVVRGVEVQVPIGVAQLISGRADFEWTTPTEFAGDYTITADYHSDGQLTPSRWRFPVHVEKPNINGAMRYSMARLNHVVNLMSSRTEVTSELAGGGTRDLQMLLRDEFDLQLVESYFRAESVPDLLTFRDVEETLTYGGVTHRNTVGVCVRTTMFVAANENALVIVIRGTDGAPNSNVNDAAGSPSSWPDDSDIAVHPGWAWMSSMLVNGFSEARCQDDKDWTNPDFSGLANLITQHRIDSTTGSVRQVYITGHSLGGSMARMTAVQMTPTTLFPGDRVYTFGAPWQGAYNLVFELDGFEFFARDRLDSHGISLETLQGGRDPIPGRPEKTVEDKWASGMASNYHLAVVWATLGRSTRCAYEEVKSWFGGGDGCEDSVVGRPIGYDAPQFSTFTSSSHPKRNADGSIVVGADGNPVYHSTDVGIDNVLQSRAHWVGDYEFAMKRRLRGDPTRFNFWFPADREGDIRAPIEIVPIQ